MTEKDADRRSFTALLVGFGGQLAGRLVDLQWHATHDEFEGGVQQVQAHWLVWLATLFVIWVGAAGARNASEPARRGYFIVLLANLVYAAVAIAHFFQHLNRLEVDWAHVLLFVSNIVGAVGVAWVLIAELQSRRRRGEARV